MEEIYIQKPLKHNDNVPTTKCDVCKKVLTSKHKLIDGSNFYLFYCFDCGLEYFICFDIGVKKTWKQREKNLK